MHSFRNIYPLVFLLAAVIASPIVSRDGVPDDVANVKNTILGSRGGDSLDFLDVDCIWNDLDMSDLKDSEKLHARCGGGSNTSYKSKSIKSTGDKKAPEFEPFKVETPMNHGLNIVSPTNNGKEDITAGDPSMADISQDKKVVAKPNAHVSDKRLYVDDNRDVDSGLVKLVKGDKLGIIA